MNRGDIGWTCGKRGIQEKCIQDIGCETLKERDRLEYKYVHVGECGPGSVVCTATGYGMDGPGIESRGSARFSAPVQTGPGAHTASCTMGTGSFPGVKSGRDVTLTPHPF